MCLIAKVKFPVARLLPGRWNLGRNTASNKEDAATGSDFEDACIPPAVDGVAERELCRPTIKPGHADLVSCRSDPLGEDVDLVSSRQ